MSIVTLVLWRLVWAYLMLVLPTGESMYRGRDGLLHAIMGCLLEGCLPAQSSARRETALDDLRALFASRCKVVEVKLEPHRVT
jgi:hypothetical protein